LQVIGVSYLFFIITQNGEIFKVKNVLKIEKNEEINYEFGKQRGCEKRIVPKKKKDQEFIMNSRSFFLL
jgi:hypothetical protein